MDTYPDDAIRPRVRRVIDAHPELRDLPEGQRDSLADSVMAAVAGGAAWESVSGALDTADRLRDMIGKSRES